MHYSLHLYNRITGSGAFLGSLTRAARGWRRTIRSNGGPWAGEFAVHDKPDFLQRCFTSWLGMHVIERVGSVITWEGLITELELIQDGIRRLRSLDLVANAVRTTYVDIVTALDQVHERTHTTPWATDAPSITRYGRKEQTLYLTAPQATALALRDTFLKEHAYPWPRPVATRPLPAPSLIVRVSGYARTANWMYALTGTAASTNVSDWITALLGTATGLSSRHGGSTANAGDCQFLAADRVTTNTLQVCQYTPIIRRAWDLLISLTQLGDGAGNPYRLYVRPGRLVHYEPISPTPRYYLKRGAVYDRIDAAQPVPP